MVRQTCVVEVGQQLFFLHEPLIQPVSQGLWLHRNLFYGVHPEGERQEDREMKHTHTHKKKDYWGLTQQKLSALIWCESCSPNPGCQPWSLNSSLSQTGIYYSSLCVYWSFSFGEGEFIKLAGSSEFQRETDMLSGALTGDRQDVQLHKMVWLEVCGRKKLGGKKNQTEESLLNSGNNFCFQLFAIADNIFNLCGVCGAHWG